MLTLGETEKEVYGNSEFCIFFATFLVNLKLFQNKNFILKNVMQGSWMYEQTICLDHSS